MNSSHNTKQYIAGRFLSRVVRRAVGRGFLLLVSLAVAAQAPAQSPARSEANASKQGAQQSAGRQIVRPQTVMREGVEVEFSIAPIIDDKSAEMMEGRSATIRFKITDTATRTPITNLRPSAWIDAKAVDKPTETKECREKIQSFLKGSLRARPEIDLNTYYLLVMNKEASISVIDPLLGFGTSKLFTLILLDAPGEDWVMSRDGKRLFITEPSINKVAVIDTDTFKVVGKIDVGAKPLA